MLGKTEGRRRRGRLDEMVEWHHQLDGHEFEQAPGVGDGHEFEQLQELVMDMNLSSSRSW